MTFSLTGNIPTKPADDSGARLASGATADAQVDALPAVDILPPFWFVETFRDELRDDAGNLTGYRDTTSGPGFSSVDEYDANLNLLRSKYRDSSGYASQTEQSYGFAADGSITRIETRSSGSGPDYSFISSATYDGDYNLINAEYSDSQGYRSTSLRSELRNGSGVLTGYRLESSGSSGSGGYSYSSIELFDADYMLVRSEYSDGLGYRSTYSIETQRDSAGNVTGYVTRYSWTDGTASYSSTDRFDGAWNYLNGDSSKPDLIVDDGPAVLPPVTAEAGMSARAAVAGAASPASDDDTEARESDRTIDLRDARHARKTDASLLGREDLDATGDTADNQISGNAGDNRIDGRQGSDTLFGGLGEDVFVIRVGGRGDPDLVTDFGSGDDRLALKGGRLRKLFDADGGLKDDALGHRLVYDADTGELRFDRDGADGKAGSVVLAVLVGVSDLHADDFIAG